MVLPTVQCRNAANSLAVKAAIDGISACAPVDSGIPVTISPCATENAIWLAFINQIKVAFCYVFGQITSILSSLMTIDDEITAIQAELPPTHPAGTPTLSAGGAAGSSPTLTVQAGSTDTDGFIIIQCGTSPTAAGGLMAQLVFANSFTNPIRVLLTIGGVAHGYFVQHTPVLSGPVASAAIYVFDPTSAITNGTQFRISYSVRELVP